MRKLRFAVALFWLWMWAYSVSNTAPVPTPTLSRNHILSTPSLPAHFRILSWMVPIPNLAYSQDDKDTLGVHDQSVIANSNFRSPFYEYDKTKPLLFFIRADGVRRLVGQINIGSAPDGSLLLVQFEKPDQLKITDYPDDLNTFPLGGYHFMNFSKEKLDLEIDGQKVTIEPDQDIVRLPKSDLRTTISISRTSDAKQLYTNVFTLKSSARWIFFLTETPDVGFSFLRLSDTAQSALLPTPIPAPTPTPVKVRRKHHLVHTPTPT